ncbi:MAG: ABC transporter permease subunit [Spirochaetaceae bacterium]|jgi:thiamine transport system permease protein|nr:ABC transporter permease subunit [Spirochaetaceae bacterium]
MKSPRVPFHALVPAVLPLGVLFFAFLLPYGAALGRAGGGGAFLLEICTDARIQRVIVFTVKQAFLSTLTALALGLPGAVIMASSSGKGRAVLRTLTALPFAMPSILVVLGFVLFFGNAGWINRLIAFISGKPEGPFRILYRPLAVVLAHGFYNFPLVIRLTGDSMTRARKAFLPPASSLGAPPLLAALTVLLPLSLPSLCAAALLAFLYSFTSFAVVLVLGGGPGASTLAVEIYRYARISLDFDKAGVLALTETVIAVLVFCLYLFCVKKAGRSGEYGEEGQDLEVPRNRLPGIAYGILVLLVVIGPLLSIPLESLLYRASRAAPPLLSARYWLGLGKTIAFAWGRSMLLALGSATLATFLALSAAFALRESGRNAGRSGKTGLAIRAVMVSPLVSSGVVLTLGWIILYGRSARSLAAVFLIHSVGALPFAFSSLEAGLSSLPENIMNAAASCGAGPRRSLVTVALPMSLGHIRSAWGLSAALSLGELNALLMLGIRDFETLPLFIYRAAGAYRYGVACAGGTVLIASCFAALLLSEAGASRRVKHKKPGDTYGS